ncbi:MAG: hypothetical protein JST84_12485 [Acidobacteria bacterium]|nr:hypothetical protein [Acidobacteriota bacterium]
MLIVHKIKSPSELACSLGPFASRLPFSSGSANSERGGVGNYYYRYDNYVNNRYYHTNAFYRLGNSSKLWKSKRHCDYSGNAVGENWLSD